MSASKLGMYKKDLYDLLQKRPRSLGQSNELRVIVTAGLVFMMLILSGLLLIAHVMGVSGALVDQIYLRSPEKITGRVTYLEDTNVSVNDELVVRIGFAFELNGKSYEGYSHATWSIPSEGQEVPIEYNKGNPAIARVAGTTYGFMGSGSLILFGIFIGLTLLIIAFILKRNLKWRYLLMQGAAGAAVYKDMKDTGAAVNEQPVYTVYFDLEVKGKTHEIKVRTHQVADIVDEEVELVLYNENNPEDFVLFDQLQVNLSMTHPGEWDPYSSVKGPALKLIFCLVPLVFALYLISKVVLLA